MNGKKRVLIVDDNEDITRLLEHILNQAGYRVTSSNDAAQTVDMVARIQPDLVILDVCMPELDGWELCRRIREEHGMPILMLTVIEEVASIKRAFLAGADAYMTKPFLVGDFLERVSSLLHRGIRRLEAKPQTGSR